MKDTWRDAERGLEGEIYERLEGCEGIAVMHSYGSVTINGDIDTTLTLIRRGQLVEGNHIDINTSQEVKAEKARSAIPDTSPDQRHGVTYYVDEYLPPADKRGCPPQQRVHSRLVMRTYGWPVKYATSPVKLLIALRAAIKGICLTLRPFCYV